MNYACICIYTFVYIHILVQNWGNTLAQFHFWFVLVICFPVCPGRDQGGIIVAENIVVLMGGAELSLEGVVGIHILKMSFGRAV